MVDAWHFRIGDITAQLPDADGAMRFAYALRHGTMKVGLFAPRGPDDQSPHRQDELYVIAAGSGRFDKAGDFRAFGPGDVLFVEAGAVHRFVDCSDDFAAWVIFWGPDGGEG